VNEHVTIIVNSNCLLLRRQRIAFVFFFSHFPTIQIQLFSFRKSLLLLRLDQLLLRLDQLLLQLGQLILPTLFFGFRSLIRPQWNYFSVLQLADNGSAKHDRSDIVLTRAVVWKFEIWHCWFEININQFAVNW